MKIDCSKPWLTLSLLLAMGCGARTPLDDWGADESTGPVAGGGTIQSSGAGGNMPSFGGSPATGGFDGLAGASGQGGAPLPDTGCPPYCPPLGGTTGGDGGASPTGGAGGTLIIGGTPVGGRGRTGGAVPFGGFVLAGRGGSGGALIIGGSPVGGRVSTGGAVPFGGSVVGGRGGSIPSGGSLGGGRGGTAGTGGAGGMGGTTCPGLAGNEELIDDMNDGDRFIPQVNGRAGAWKDRADATSSSTMFPDPAGTFTMTNTGDACRKYAVYVYGGPFVDEGPTLFFGIGGPYNASKYDGISFWAKIDSGTSSGLRVAFPDKDTQPDGGLCQPGVTGPTMCWDHYGMRITLTTTWTKYTVPFASLSQDGWGRKGASFDRSTIYEVQFQIPVNAKFGIWIDDVAFTGYFGPVI